MVATVTLQIPDEVYQRLQLNAAAIDRSVEDLLMRVVQVGGPPQWDDVPVEFQADVAALDHLSDDALRQLADGLQSEANLDRYDLLLEKNAAGELSSIEREELTNLRQSADKFMLRKAHAAVLLNWRKQAAQEI